MTTLSKNLQFAGNAIGIVRGRSAKTDTRVAGLKELLEGLMELPDALGNKTVLGAMRAAGNVVKKEAVGNAPMADASHPMVRTGWRKSGTIQKRIVVARSKYTNPAKDWFEVIVSVKGLGKKKIQSFKKKTGLAGSKNPDDPFYWWWVEFGTATQAAQPFLRPAFEGTKSQQLEKIRKSMKSGISREARKIAAKVNSASGKS